MLDKQMFTMRTETKRIVKTAQCRETFRQVTVRMVFECSQLWEAVPSSRVWH